MNYEITTSRWTCPDCGSPLRLCFFQRGSTAPEDDASDEFVCDRIVCDLSHAVPDELVALILPEADQEFTAALERGSQVGQIWQAPAQDGLTPPEDDPRDPDLGSAA